MSREDEAPDVPQPDPAAQLIRRLREDLVPKVSTRTAARRAGISETHWRNIERGFQRMRGTSIPVRANDETLAKMALAVGASPDQLAEFPDRQPAAERLRRLMRDVVRGEPELGAVGERALDAAEAGDDALVDQLAAMLDRIRNSDLSAKQKGELKQLMITKISGDLEDREQEITLRIQIAESES